MEKKSLYQKIHKVMRGTKSLEKAMTVGQGKNSYQAVSEAEVLNAVKPLLLEHGLIIIPVSGEMTDKFEKYMKYDKEAIRAITILKVNYKIIDIETGESEILVGFGYGADSQDKGAGKASTYSYKNALSKTFMLFSGDDTDQYHSDDIEAGSTGQNQGKKQGSASKDSKTPPKKKEASKPQEKAKKEPEKVKEETPPKETAKGKEGFTAETTLPSSKYAGRTLKDVAKFDPEWVNKLATKSTNARVREVATEVLKNTDQE